jgi:hypothetical protein
MRCGGLINKRKNFPDTRTQEMELTFLTTTDSTILLPWTVYWSLKEVQTLV